MADSAKGFVFLSPFFWWSSVVEALGSRDATLPGGFCPASLLFLVSSLGFSALLAFSSPAARAALENVSVMQKAVEHSGDCGAVAEQLTPVFNWAI